MLRDGFALPLEVRRVRAWWLREAREHLRKVRTRRCQCLGGGCRKWHIGQAAQARQYARGVVAKFHETGSCPFSPCFQF